MAIFIVTVVKTSNLTYYLRVYSTVYLLSLIIINIILSGVIGLNIYLTVSQVSRDITASTGDSREGAQNYRKAMKHIVLEM
jgi:hypothetical protein